MSVKRFGIVDADGLVINTIDLDPNTEWNPKEGCTLFEHERISIGDKIKNGELEIQKRLQPADIENDVIENSVQEE